MHLFLKQVGRLFLLNQGCHTVETEVTLNQLGLKRLGELDNKKVVDVLGLGLRYKPIDRVTQGEGCGGFTSSEASLYEVGVNVLRGVEVKVSRGDFRNGFVCAGCNYNYVLTPARLVSPSLLPRGVGLVEYNRYKFSCEASEGSEARPYRIEGLRVVRRAHYRELPRFQVDHAIASIAERRLPESRRTALAEVIAKLNDPTLRYFSPESG